MEGDLRQATAKTGERLAVEHLKRSGYRIVAKNFRCSIGELDIIAHHDHTLIFCEVKTRKVRNGYPPPNPFEAITLRKQQRVRQLAGVYIQMHRPRLSIKGIRCDAVAVLLDEDLKLFGLEHLRGAF